MDPISENAKTYILPAPVIQSEYFPETHEGKEKEKENIAGGGMQSISNLITQEEWDL